MILPVILAGGSGDRLWPLSRKSCPKQFLALLGHEKSLFQETIKRLPSSDSFLPPLIVCHEDYRFLVAEQLRQINVKPSTIILESSANNTAPAIALAAKWSIEHHKDAQLLILPADHLISDLSQFYQSIATAESLATQQYLVTFGIRPTRPETGYGYIKYTNQIQDTKAFNVEKFTEKPDLKTAEQFIAKQNYLWNSGMFLINAKVYLTELKAFQPTIFKHVQSALNSTQQDLDFIRPDAAHYNNCPKLSIDYAIMEKTQKAAVVPFEAKWSDIGSWQAIWEEGDKDHQGNHIQGDVMLEQTTNCLIDARARFVGALGLEDMVIVETADAVLVASKDQSQNIKQLVSRLKDRNAKIAIQHRQVMRPWGWFESISEGERFQVKRIVVTPGKSLSLQLHHHRSEHWVVVKGSAKVLRGDQTFFLSENESTYIPVGTKHQLSNVGKIPLEIIEVQSGSYLGEDDIVRIEDEHGRVTTKEGHYA